MSSRRETIHETLWKLVCVYVSVFVIVCVEATARYASSRFIESRLYSSRFNAAFAIASALQSWFASPRGSVVRHESITNDFFRLFTLLTFLTTVYIVIHPASNGSRMDFESLSTSTTAL